ncbi:MAG: hypothetical protein AABZ74_12335 [Cyanobacteriota bacterium]
MRSFLVCFFVVIVFLGFLISLALPSFISSPSGSRPPLAEIKSNMHTFQTILETYSVDSKGSYPKNVEELYKFANTGNNKYWKDFKSPFSHKFGKSISFDDFDKKLLEKKSNNWFFKEEIKCSGCVYYSFSMSKKGQIDGYFIYGSDKNGEIIIDVQSGLPFTLSNN